MEPLPERILVIGTSGAGKSTLSKELSDLLHIERVELDDVHWLPNWGQRPKDEFYALVEKRLESNKENKWVIDGNYRVLRPLLYPKATHVVWLDYPLYLILWRLIIRTFSRMLSREKVCNGNVERWTNLLSLDPETNIIVWAITSYARQKKDYTEFLKQDSLQNLEVMRFNSPKQTSNWVQQLKKLKLSE